MIYVGVDPGQSGGIAMLDTLYCEHGSRPLVIAKKMPSTVRDIWLELNAVDTSRCHAWLERVSAMPKQGVSSTFKFGTNYGMLQMALTAANIPFDLVSPAVWQRSLSCLSKGDKNVTKGRAQQLFPQLKVTHAIADALLLAEYGRRLRQQEGRS